MGVWAPLGSSGEAPQGQAQRARLLLEEVLLEPLSRAAPLGTGDAGWQQWCQGILQVEWTFHPTSPGWEDAASRNKSEPRPTVLSGPRVTGYRRREKGALANFCSKDGFWSY